MMQMVVKGATSPPVVDGPLTTIGDSGFIFISITS